MKFIITDFFEKQFRKTVTDMDIEEMIQKIHIDSKNFIHFKDPYIKVKIRTENKAYRIVLLIDKEESNILFINIFDKKDKNYGDYLNWNLHKADILFWTEKNIECMKNKNFYTKLS